MKIISVNGLFFVYPTQAPESPALKDVNFEVDEGECVAVLGPTGAGKSTLCLAMNGLIPEVVSGKLEGNVVINGLDTRNTRVSKLATVVGLMFQDPESQLVGMTVEEEMFFGAGNYGVPREEIRKRSKSALELLRLTAFEEREPGTLSGGEKQRVSLAAVLVMKPKLLVLDEPTSELDPLGRAEVFEALNTLKRDLGISILITSHNIEGVANIADRVLVLNEGSIVFDGPTQKILQRTKPLRKLGVRPPQVTQFWKGLEGKGVNGLGQAPIILQSAINEFRSKTNMLVRIDPMTNPPKKSKKSSVNKPPEAIIRVNDLYFSYPDGTEAIKGLDIEIKLGEYVAIIGQNGSGKTTLVKHFNGLLKPSNGIVIVGGTETKGARTADLSHNVTYCFQNPDHQIFLPSVWEEVAFGPTNLDFSQDRIDESVNRALEMVGLENSKDVYPFNLGKGQRQMVALASVIAMQSKVLIIDEPTTGLDWKSGSEVMGILRELNKDGHTIVVITHDMEIVAQDAKRTVVLHQGKLLLDGPTDIVLSKIDELKKTYLEPPQITRFAIALEDKGFPPNILTVEDALQITHKA